MTSTKRDELKPCPLCGKEAHLQFNGATTLHHDVCVMCSHCGLTTKWFKGIDKVQEAIKLWNTRPSAGGLSVIKSLLCQFEGEYLTLEIINKIVGEIDSSQTQSEQDGEGEAVKELVEALKSLTDDEPCSFDHHGYCQTHFSGSSPCLNAEALKLISKHNSK